MYVAVDETGRIGATTPYEEYKSNDMIMFDFPDDFDFNTQNDYRIVNGELIHDPIPQNVEKRINELKKKLSNTDYVVIKISEASHSGETLDGTTMSRYQEIIKQRQQWRAEINELEAQLEGALNG